MPGSVPKTLDRYVKEIKESNPDYSDEQAWATAWSRFCKYKKPDSPHCHRPPAEYFKGREAVVIKVAARYALATA